VVLGLASSGVHSNGFSLVRKILATSGARLDTPFEGSTVGATLLTPTRIYVRPLLALLREMPVKGLAHITGGGLVENVPRVLPDNVQARLERRAWHRPPIFDWLQQQGRVTEAEMQRVFNCGIGMVAIVAREHADTCCERLRASGETVQVIGEIVPRRGGEPGTVVIG
jgi:phosphoribosylformylglycinamidine cyclo-ligase